MPQNTILFDNFSKGWLSFTRPVATIIADSIQDVLPALNKISNATEHGLYAAGFISYEAAPAFDSALNTKEPGPLPFLQFGIFEKPEQVDIESIKRKYFVLAEWEPTVSHKKYLDNIHAIKQNIVAGQTYQVNYTYRLFSSFSGDPQSFFLSLLSSQKTKYAMYMEWDEYAICSVSPELFFLLDGERIVCKPMKGTAKRGRYFAEDQKQAEYLKSSTKDQSENVMIVDMMRNDLGRIAKTGTVKVDSLFDIERYNTAWQMTSTVSAQTSTSLTEIFKALFPCASITGAPKASTMGIINQLEQNPRNIYTGAIGLIQPNRRAQFNVAIRTVLIDKKKNQAEYGTGGGIVWDSIPEKEFEESRIKSQILFTKKEPFDLLETILWEKPNGYFLLDYHLKRMQESAQYLSFVFPLYKINKELKELGASLNKNRYKVRLLLNTKGNVTIQSFQITEKPSNPVRLGLSQKTVNSQNPMLFNKTTNRTIYQSALSTCPDCDDVLMVNEKGQITETTICNIVVRLKDKLVTPELDCGLLPGTFRQYLLDKGEIIEGTLTREDLTLCEEIFVINSVQKWRRAELVELKQKHILLYCYPFPHNKKLK